MEQIETTEIVKPTRMKFTEKNPLEIHRDYLDMDTDEEEFGHQETPEPLDEAPPEPERPRFTNEELDQLVEATKSLTILPNLSDDCWTGRCLETIRQFFREPTELILTIFFRRNKLLSWLGYPKTTDSGLMYFLRESWQIYRPNNFISTVSFGNINDRIELTMLRFIEGLYAPLAFKKQDWPTIKKDQIFSNLDDFLTRAIDVTYSPMGMLLLYVPWEGSQRDDQDEVQLLNRLEKVARMWIKQIRQMIANIPSVHRELYHLHSEFQFWQRRYENLACVSQQLSSDQVQSIVKQLRKFGSPSVKQLKSLVGKVDRALDEAKSNLAFLNLVLESCKNFDRPEQIDEYLPKCLLVIRFVWTESSYYHSLDNLERLLCSLSVCVVKVCINNVNINLIFEDPKKCGELMKANLHCCHSYAQIYENVVDICMNDESTWKVDKDKVFKPIKAFEQRCNDVLEICDAILIYGSSNKITFGGMKGNHYGMQYNAVKNHFAHIMNGMRVCCDYALDITKVQWFQDMCNFRNDVNELESTIKNVFINLFKEVNSVEMGIETLYTLLQFKERKAFQDMLHEEWIKVWEIFYDEIKLCLLSTPEDEIVIDQLKFPQSKESMMKSINQKYLSRLRKMMIDASDWLGDCDIQDEILSKYPYTD